MLIQRLTRLGLLALGLLLALVAFPSVTADQRTADGRPSSAERTPALLRKGDRVAWIGSSSTRIGIWPRTVEFLMRTRHPAYAAEFQRFTTGGGTFANGLENLDRWVDQFHPTVVVFNYGGNDALAGEAGLSVFKQRMAASADRVRARGARTIFVTPQAADVRRSGPAPAALRTLYAETMLGYGRERGWAVVDVHHPLETMQRSNQQRDPKFTILKDTIHLTGPAYIAWGFLFYDRLDLPLVRSAATLTADGEISSTENCTVRDVTGGPSGLAFTRTDAVLPVLPPVPLPPRDAAPLEAHSRYLLQVTGLPPGSYEIFCERQPIGTVRAGDLAVGVNLNTLLLDSGNKAPWSSLATMLWEGEGLQRVGNTPWRFEVVPKKAAP